MTVYAPGSQVKSADLNQWQTELYGTHEIWVPASDGLFIAETPGLDPADYFSQAGAPSAWGSRTTGGFFDLYFRFNRMRVGDRLLSVTVHGRDGGVAGEEIQAELQYISATGAITAVSTNKTSALVGGNTSIGWTVADTDFTPDGFTFLAGRAHQLDIVMPQTSADAEARIYAVSYTFNRPNPVP